MPSLTNRPNGIPAHPLKGAGGNILLKTSSLAYKHYISLRSDDRAVLDTLLYVATTNTNHFIAAGAVLDIITEQSGYVTSSVMSSIKRLKNLELINALDLDYEYIVNPLLAIKGSECEVWKFIQTIQHKGTVPKDVQLTCGTLTLTSNY